MNKEEKNDNTNKNPTNVDETKNNSNNVISQKSKSEDINEEKQIGLFQTASTRTYLEQTVSDVIMQGMSELARLRPENPLEYLGNFILSKAKSNK
jgi:nickel-dependent lactate racemase